MNKLTVDDLLKLDEYAERREEFRRRVIAHKKRRTVHLGPNVTLLFEDRLLVQYQVQEMLRIERIFERAAIEEELAAYNPLIPDGRNWKATCLIEFEDAGERREALKRLKGLEHRIWVQVGNAAKLFAIADEDLDRGNEEKTSAVHFLRFELGAQAAAARAGAAITLGVEHSEYRAEVVLGEDSAAALNNDLN